MAVLLHDGAAATGGPDARDTLIELRHVGAALEQHGYHIVALPVDLDLGRLARELRELGPAVVFNLVESIDGRGELIAVVPAVLESLNLPFTGCGALAQALTSDKRAAKRHMRAAGLPVPAIYAGLRDSDGPWIVKSVSEHSSFGLDDASVVARAEEVPPELARRRAAYGGDWFAERYIEGRELNVAVIESPRGVDVLPVAEIRFVDYPADKPHIVGYAAKWERESPEYCSTERVFVQERHLSEPAAALARRCWELFDLAGYARVDLRIDVSGAPWVLEVNANPCLSPDAGFAAALTQAGVDFAAAVGWLASAAVARRARVASPARA
jgi:D-alanine-D-alanine ligase